MDRAAKRLQITTWSVYRWTREGKLHPRQIGNGKVLIARAEVDALLEGRKWTPADSEPKGFGDPGYPLAK